MSAIRQVLFGWLGVKEPKRFKATDNIDISKLGLPVMKVTSKAVDAWEAAGRPEPKKFFAEYKNDA